MKFPVVLRGEVEIDEKAFATPSAVLAPEPFADRRPAWLEEGTFQRFLKQAEKRHVGRRTLYRPSDLVAWVERHPVKCAEPSVDAEADDPIDFAEFKRTALRPPRNKRCAK